MSVKRFLQKTVRVLLWLSLTVVLLLIVIAASLQIPSVQNYAAQKATAFLRKKTQTHISLDRIGISFPKSVYISKFLLMDQHNDTLLYAGELKVNIRMLALLKNEINISEVTLSNTNAKLSRTENDSTYNFNFLIEAFSGNKKEVTEEKKDGLAINLEEVTFDNIRFEIDDKYEGLKLSTHLTNFNASFEETNINALRFAIDNIFVDGFSGTLRQTKKTEPSLAKKDTALPYFHFENAELKNINFNLINDIDKEATGIHIGELKTGSIDVDLKKETLKSESIKLSNSFAHLTIRSPKDSIAENIPVVVNGEMQNNWTISVKSINLQNNALKYKDPSAEKVSTESFNPADIDISKISLNASDIIYSPALTQISISAFEMKSNDKFSIENLRTNFKMTERSVEASELYLKTSQSEISLSAKIYFKNPEALKAEPGKTKFDVDIKRVHLYHPELIYFVSELKNEPAIAEALYTNIQTRVKGELQDFSATKVKITTGTATKLYGNINVKGLPDLKKLALNIPDFNIESSQKDVILFVGNKIPPTINIPESFSVNIDYTGTLQDFKGGLNLESTLGNIAITGEMSGEQYDIAAHIKDMDLSTLLKKTELLGILDGKIKIKGSGLDTNTVNAHVLADINRVTLNKYTYQNLNADVKVDKKSFNGSISLKDEYAELDVSGFADLNSGKKHIDVDIDLKGADLKQLNLMKQDLRIAFKAVADLQGNDINSISGNAGITGIVLSKAGKKYILDSLLFAAINEKGNSSLNIKSAVVGIDYKGDFAPAQLADELKQTFSNYFGIDASGPGIKSKLQNFELKIELNNHPVISEVFLPDLQVFEPGEISASYNSEKNKLKVVFAIDRLHYGNIEVDEFKADINGEEDLTYNISALRIMNANLRFDKFLIDGATKDKIATTLLTAENENGKQKISLKTRTAMDKEMVKVNIDQFALLEQEWKLSGDNSVVFGKNTPRINNLLMTRNESTVHITSEKMPNNDIHATFKNLKLEELSSIIQKDTLLVAGNLNGTLQLKPVNKSWGIISDISIDNFQFREIPLGTLTANASNNAENKFDISVKLNGHGNAVTAEGYFKPSENGAILNFDVGLEPITMKTIEAFSMGQINQTEGKVTGKFVVTGNTASPEINGHLTFKEVKLNPALLNSRLYLKNETVTLDGKGLHLKSFTMLDKNNQPAIVSGSVNTKNIHDIKFDLSVNTNNFLLLNTRKNSGSDYYGTLVVDSKIKIKGSPSHPVITSSIKLKDKSQFTFAVPESKLSTDKGDGIVLFVDSTKFNRILTRNQKEENQKFTVKNLDISSTVEIDKKAILKLMLDPASEDSLVVRGSGALSFALDPSGKITLTGLYNIVEGTYLASMENLLKRQFKIESGSSITWNGDPLDADINLNAYYLIRTSPVDLVADQIPVSERNQYRQRFPFLVFLKLKGPILSPEISFDIRLRPVDRGAMNGLLHARLEQLKENPNALNKQVFALLVLGRFVQENPLETDGGGGTETAARKTVGNFLSAQLNKFTAKMVPGVDINFDVQSYDDHSTANSQARTEVGVGVSKQLFNDRVNVQVGGSVDVEGERAQKNKASEIAGDVTVEYKATRDGRYRLKGFRLNQYEGALEGQIIQTGVGLLYTRDFETWLQLISKEKKENTQDSLNVGTERK